MLLTVHQSLKTSLLLSTCINSLNYKSSIVILHLSRVQLDNRIVFIEFTCFVIFIARILDIQWVSLLKICGTLLDENKG